MHLAALMYVMIPGSSLSLGCFLSTFLRRDSVTQWYTLFTQSQCALLLVLWCQDGPLVAEVSYDERALVWTLLIESGHIPLRTILGNCSRDLYRPLRLRLLAWAQQVVFQGLHHIWAILQANRS